MNENHSHNELYYSRWLTTHLQDALSDHSVIVLTGARQVGKSTLLRNEKPFSSWLYRTFDDLETMEQARVDPTSLWAGTESIILDEVQRAPEVLLAVKHAVDSHPGKYHFVLSGSANLLLMKQVSESLAGRAVYFVLHPLTLGEQKGDSPPQLLAELLAGKWPKETQIDKKPQDPSELLLRGSMPGLLALENPTAWLRWWEGYVLTYLERDLRQISQIDSLLDFRRLMELLGLYTGRLLNQTEVGRDVNIVQSTAHRYINLLETTHLLERLPAFTAGRMQRLVKTPKVFWTDPGLPVFLSGYFDIDALRNSREYGLYFEGFIYQHLRVLSELLTPKARLYFWRTQGGQEVDFIIEHGRKTLAIEVKMTQKPNYQHTAGIRSFLKAHPTAVGGVLVHGGKDIRYFGENIIAVPWTLLTGGL